MNWLEKKPAFPATAALMLGIVFAHFSNWPIPWLLGFFAVALLLALFSFFKNYAVVATTSLLLTLFLLGAARLRMETKLLPKNHISAFADLPCTVAVEGVLCKPVEARGEGLSTVLDVDSIWVSAQRFPANGRCLLRVFKAKPGPAYGDRIVVRGQLRSPPGERNPGEFNYRNYLAAQDIHAVFSAASARQILLLNTGEGSLLLRSFVYPARRFILSFIDSTMSGQQAAILKALLVGARGDVDSDLRKQFANVGVIHVLAVSGLHVGFILAGFLGIFSFLRIRNPWRTLLTVIGLLFYAWLTGLSPSVFRASVMAIVFLGGRLLQRRFDILNSLAVAAFILLTIQPLDLFQPGFQLSFAAVAGIVLLYNRFAQILRPLFYSLQEKGLGLFSAIITLFFVSLAAQLATLPLTAYYFGRIPIVSLLANLIVVPLVAVIVSLGLVAVLAAALSFSLGGIFANTVWLLLTALIAIVKAAAKLPIAYLAVARPSAWAMTFYVLFLLLFVVWQQEKLRKGLVFATLIFATLFVWTQQTPASPAVQITFFDVGQGDAALLQFPNGKTMLVDAGDCTEYVDSGERIILPYLRRQGVRRIDCLLLSHSHADHIGGAPSILENMPVGRLVESGCAYPSEISETIDSLALVYNIRKTLAASGDTLLLDPDVDILVLHPTKEIVKSVEENPADLNNASVVIQCRYHGHSILLVGDAEIPAEKAMLRFGSLLRSDVLKVGHHGSPTASSADFRHTVSPLIAVVSVAKYNRFGLPSDSLLQEFVADGVKVMKTSDVGAVQLRIGSNGIRRLR